jgi:hypothetical protein
MSSKMDKINATAVIQSMPLPQPLTRLDVEKRQAEENRCEKQHRQILHRNSLSFRARQLSEQLPLAMLRNDSAGRCVGMAEGFSKD